MIKISGIVQGVGMRPTIYRYALEWNLSGFVANTAQGVVIEVEGGQFEVDAFFEKIKTSPPPIARIERLTQQDIPIKNDRDVFRIDMSRGSGEKLTEISPDIATCKDCQNDINDPKNRRFQYAFTNCTNCGPRFTIIHDRPYDRPLTSMKHFKMCKECAEEYHDPCDRRFHAQPNACPVCGPKLYIIAKMNESCEMPLEYTVNELKKGGIAAIKGLGGFNIACDPLNPATVERLRKIKRRKNKSFALMMRDIELVRAHCEVSTEEEIALKSSISPIVLLKKIHGNSFQNISPDNNYLGVMLPYTPLHHLLLSKTNVLVMTSANKVDEPIAINDQEVKKLLEDKIVDFALSHDREIVHRADDSIVQFLREKMQVIRRSRGFVPTPFYVENLENGSVLSLGANMKNTFAIRKDENIYLSQHIGELIDYRNYDFQKNEILDFKTLLDISPKNISADAHPGYENYNSSNQLVYHHHAHMLSVMGEHNLLGKNVLGVICDGTGYGSDGKIWGFEFLSAGKDYRHFERVAHLRYFPLPGGEMAIKEIDRISFALSRDIENDFSNMGHDRRKMLETVIKNGVNTPLTSSLGRLFDGVAALIGIVSLADYEARAAILLQKYAENFKGKTEGYIPHVIDEDTPMIIDFAPLIGEIILDLGSGVSKEEMAMKFHLWVVDVIGCVVDKISPEYVVFSGGCFQNSHLCILLMDFLDKTGMTYYFNQNIPINDAGVAFGQAMI
ncbi:MAG: carbamoyltransferase HypF [Bacteriovoracaceae bacterium]|nr:carbamoyltransferase HypF [Bacteriovoracaceae bacterium]